MELVHATCVALDKKGVLLSGPSGAGKSDLALRLIRLGGVLVGDDYVELHEHRGRVIANPPEKIAGKMEIRGVGLRDLKTIKSVEICLIINLVPRAEVPRLPEEKADVLCGIKVPCYALHAFDGSTPDKIALLLAEN